MGTWFKRYSGIAGVFVTFSMLLIAIPSIVKGDSFEPPPPSVPFSPQVGNVADNVDLFTGDLSLTNNLMTLPGRNGLDLPVAAFYRSSVGYKTFGPGGHAFWVGLGWRMGFGHIRADLKETFDISDDEFYYIGPRGGSVKIIETGEGFQLEKCRFWRIESEISGGRIENWIIYHPDGTKYTFGNNHFISWGVDSTWVTQNYLWDLTKIEDPEGNTIRITYYNDIDSWPGKAQAPTYTRASYPDKIYDSTGRTIVFEWEEREHDGVGDEWGVFGYNDLLRRLTIRDEDWSDIRIFHFNYGYMRSYDWSYRLILTSITEFSADGDSLPSTRFTYWGREYDQGGTLKRITYPTGATKTFSYESRPTNCDPFSFCRVDTVTVSDPMGNDTIQTTYAYGDIVEIRIGDERTDCYFGHTDVTVDLPGSSGEVHYLFETDTITHLEGYPTEIKYYEEGTTDSVKSTNYTWEAHSVDEGVYHRRLKEAVSYLWFGPRYFQTKTTLSYNNTNGLPDTACVLGSDGKLKVITARYAYEKYPDMKDEAYMISQVYSTTVSTQSGAVKSRKWTAWKKDSFWHPDTVYLWKGDGSPTDTTAPDNPATEALMVKSLDEFDSHGNLLQSTDANGNITKFYYGSNQTPFDTNGVYLTAVQGVQSDIDDPLNPNDDLFTKYQYDYGLGKLTAMVDANGDSTHYLYDGFGRLSETRNNDNQVLARYRCYLSREGNGEFNPSDPNWMQTTTYRSATDSSVSRVYSDGLGRAIQALARESGQDVIISQKVYDHSGRLAVVTKPASVSASDLGFRPGFIPQGWIIGNPMSSGELSEYYDGDPGPNCNGYPYSQTQFSDDPLGRVESIGAPGDDFRIGSGHEVGYEYGTNSSNEVKGWDANQLFKTSVVDENGKKGQSFVDKYGRQVATKGDSGGLTLVTTYGYDFLGRLTRIVPPNYHNPPSGSDSTDWVTTMTYNHLGRLTSKLTPDDSTVEYLYDKNGNLRFLRDAKQSNAVQMTYLIYDDLNRLIEIGVCSDTYFTQEYADGTLPGTETGIDNERAVYDYDNPPSGGRNCKGRLAKALYRPDPSSWGGTVYSYDEEGRMEWAKQYFPENQPGEKTTFYEYDRGGNLTQLTYPDSGVVSYQYDPAGRLSQVGDGSTPDRYATYSWWPTSQVKTMLLGPNGAAQKVDYTYNTRDWLKRINDPDDFLDSPVDDRFGLALNYYNPDGQYQANWEAQYNGNIAQIKWETENGAILLNEPLYNFRYDGVNRLTLADYDNSENESDNNNGFDVRSINYDANGNLRTLNRYGDGGGLTDYIYTYYQGRNQLKNTDNSPDEDYVYDPNGNLIFRTRGSETDTFSYDYRNLLAQATTSIALYSFSYDADGRRVKKAYQPRVADYPTANAIYVRNGLDVIYEEKKETLPTFIRGDVASDCGDGQITMADGLLILNYFFEGAPLCCLDAGDVDDSGVITLGDGLRLLNYFFSGDTTLAPEPPFPDCGLDPTPDSLDCLWHKYCMGNGRGLAYEPPVSMEGAPNRLVVGEAEISKDGVAVVPVDLVNSEPLCGFEYTIAYDPKLITAKAVDNSGLITEKFDFFAPHIDVEAGKIKVGNVPDLEMKDLLKAGKYRVANISFQLLVDELKAPMPLELENVALYDSLVNQLPTEWIDGSDYTTLDNSEDEDVAGDGAPVRMSSTISSQICYIYAGSQRIAKVVEGQVYFYLCDHLGSVRVITDELGNVENTYDYYPFGLIQSQTENTSNTYRFTGQEWDEGYDTYHFWARGYDPEIGRWTGVDPLIYPSQSPYNYCFNSPVNYTDPSGMGSEGPLIQLYFDGYGYDEGGGYIYTVDGVQVPRWLAWTYMMSGEVDWGQSYFPTGWSAGQRGRWERRGLPGGNAGKVTYFKPGEAGEWRPVEVVAYYEWVWGPSGIGGVNWTNLGFDRQDPYFSSWHLNIYHNIRHGTAHDVGSNRTITTGPGGVAITTSYGPFSATTDFRNVSYSLQLSNLTISINLISPPSVEFGISQANYGLFSESTWEFQYTWLGLGVGAAAAPVAYLAYKAGAAFGIGYGVYRLGEQFLRPAGGP